MTYQISSTTSGRFESYDLDSLPPLAWTNPTTKQQETMPARLLLQAGKIGVHELFNLLRERGVPGVSPEMGAQALLICWARHLQKQAEKAVVLIGDAAANRDKQIAGSQ